jgi:site-specific DNA-methyltransferase (adenine-specific)
MKIDEINVNDIKPYEKNAKKHPEEQIKRISNSIKAFGFKQPLVIDKDNVLVIGHGRLEAAKRLGFDTVPCVRADDLTEDQIKALRLADNKTNESDWDFDFLNIELDDITDIDMSQFGFDLDIQTEEAEIIEDEAPDDVETRAKLGDVWELGEHRLICGDCTDIAVIDTLMGGGWRPTYY